jgi:hypothetical protein
MLFLHSTLLPVLDVRLRVREVAVKYASLREVPRRQRIGIALLYLVALGVVLAANIISLLADFTIGYLAGLIIQSVLLVHLINRTGY